MANFETTTPESMLLALATVERKLRAERRLRMIHDENYELSFESMSGLQIAVNRKSSGKAVQVWVQNALEAAKVALSN